MTAGGPTGNGAPGDDPSGEGAAGSGAARASRLPWILGGAGGVFVLLWAFGMSFGMAEGACLDPGRPAAERLSSCDWSLRGNDLITDAHRLTPLELGRAGALDDLGREAAALAALDAAWARAQGQGLWEDRLQELGRRGALHVAGDVHAVKIARFLTRPEREALRAAWAAGPTGGPALARVETALAAARQAGAAARR